MARSRATNTQQRRSSMLTWKNRVFLVIFFIIGVFLGSPVVKGQEIQPKKPGITIIGDVAAKNTVTITVKTPYPKWETYFTTTGTIISHPAICEINVVGGANCDSADEYQFIVEVPVSESGVMWVFARTYFGDDIRQTEVYVEINGNDYFHVRPGEVSEYLWYLGNDNLGGKWSSTGILPAELPFSYTSPSPGALQIFYPVTGTYTLTYNVSTPYGLKGANIFLKVSADAPASRFPDAKDDYFEILEGQPSSYLGFLGNDYINAEGRTTTFGIQEADVPFPYSSPTPGTLQVVSPIAGTYTLTYYIDVYGMGRDTANIYLTVIPFKHPTNTETTPQPGNGVTYYLPTITKQEE